jgi:phage terminase large subunit
MTFHSYTELASRTKQGVFLDWNPTNPFWFHDELINDPDVDFIIINYTDNEACPESALNFILKAKEKADNGSAFWANWFRVYGLGEIGSLDGVVFQNWQQCERIPAESEFISYGLDWGFTNDPTALVEVFRYDGKIYINELLYQTKLTNSEIVNHLKQYGVNSSRCIVSDYSSADHQNSLWNHWIYLARHDRGARLEIRN